MKLRIATRESRLALWQANWVREKILAKFLSSMSNWFQ